MSGQSKKQEQEVLKATEAARDWGRDYYHNFPNLLLIEVARYAAKAIGEKRYQMAFIQGYSQARKNHDVWQAEGTS